MILRINEFAAEGKDKNPNPEKEKAQEIPKGKLKIKWIKPDLAEEIEHYDDKAKLEFYQHNITIGNKDIEKNNPRATKFFKYINEPFKHGHFEMIPSTSDGELDVKKIQNLMSYEFDNIVAGAYGKAYGDVLVNIANDLKTKGDIILPCPILFRFINFGETRTSAESSYYLFSGNRIVNLALQYNIPVKGYIIDLVPSRRDVREFAKKSGISSDPAKFKKLMRRATGKDSLDELSARERFSIIQSLKSF